VANTLITPTLVSKQALGFWQDSNILCGLFNRSYESEFGGGNGDTVTIRKQASLTASKFDRSAGVTIQDVTESKITVTVSDLYDVSVQVTQEQWDFDVQNFGWQVVEPAGRALSRQAERLVAAELVKQATPIDIVTTAGAKIVAPFLKARQAMNHAEVPLDGRFIIVGTDVAGLLLGDDQFLKANENGSDGALRNAQIGRLFGMDVIESVVVPADEAFVCLPDALTFVSLVPQIARGTADGAAGNYDGLGLRTVFGYDMTKKQDLISFDAYYEIAPLRGDPAFRRLKIKVTP
jgi:hypothetical protein